MSSAKQNATPASKMPFLAFVPAGADAEILRQFAAEKGWPEACVQVGDIRQATAYLAKQPSPELLLVDVPSQQEAPALLDALAEVCDPTTKVIVSGLVNEYSFYCWLTEIGIFNYMLRPFSESALEGVYQKSLVATPSSAAQKQPAKIIAVMGTRGGVGATSVALNFAGLLAEQTKQQVALVDLDAKEGSVALALDIEPSHGLREVLEKPDRIDSLFIERVMTKMGKHLSVLSTEESFAEHINASEQAADLLLQELRGKFDYVVLDLPRHMQYFDKQCLKYADHTILVTELTLLSLRDAIRLQDAMREAWKLKAPMVVANRVGIAAKQELLLQDFEKGVGCSVAQSIAFAPEIFMPTGKDIAAVKHKNNPAIAPFHALVSEVAPQVKKPVVAKPKTSFSLFKKKGG